MKNEFEMGRVDVLFHFLQIIEKDHPADIDEYLDSVNLDSDGRPVSDQIVDLIIAGDESLYESYGKARELAGPRSPYSGKSSVDSSSEYSASLGFFMSQWILFEKTMRESARRNGDIMMNPHMSPKKFFSYIPSSISSDLKEIRKIRNEVVHGIRKLTPEQLNEAGRALESIVASMQFASSDDA